LFNKPNYTQPTEAFVKKLLRFFGAALLLLPLASAFSQVSLYVKQQKGDTLVIKDYYDMGNTPNSLYLAMFADTLSLPPGRVYELQAAGYYPLTNGPTTTAAQPTTIIGNPRVPLVQSQGLVPPTICGSTVAGGTTQTPGINMQNNFVIKNCICLPTAYDGTENWNYFGAWSASHASIVIQNCLMEHTRWVFCAGGANSTFKFIDDYFINMNGQPCRRNGGVYDGFANEDTMFVQNCTHVMAQGSVYKLRSNIWQRIIFDHNTFVNMSGYTFLNLGYQSNMSVTNNMFVNCGVQPYPAMSSIDVGEQDLDFLPMGLVNVYPDSADVANGTVRKTLCQGNNAYWDTSLTSATNGLVAWENAAQMNGKTNWKSQSIIWNTRTDSAFKHLGRFSAYTHLVTDTWLNVMPTFTQPRDLFTTQLANLKTFSFKTVDSSTTNSNAAAVLPDFRVTGTLPTDYIYPDWPIPINLAYSNASLLTHGTDGLPVGDLNWFPTQKATFLQHQAAYYAAIQTALDNGTLVSTAVNDPIYVPGTFQLQQNYPNPFNPSTEIKYSVPEKSTVSLKVYNVLGQEVASLFQGERQAGEYSVNFNASQLASGVYFYRLEAGAFSITKKMILMK
jgi:hypothetical protein